MLGGERTVSYGPLAWRSTGLYVPPAATITVYLPLNVVKSGNVSLQVGSGWSGCNCSTVNHQATHLPCSQRSGHPPALPSMVRPPTCPALPCPSPFPLSLALTSAPLPMPSPLLQIGSHSDQLWQADIWQRAPSIVSHHPVNNATTRVFSGFGVLQVANGFGG